ncbi:MAG: protein kinase, partial [Myxococcales bacterium]|nr:protein kinase [Myxococcales bacterium]
YKAYSLRLCRPVALKMLTAGRHASEASIVRFQNEAMLAARLQHPNIVPVFDAGEHEGNLYFAMGFVEGAGFKSLIDASTKEAVRDGVRVLARAARALDYAHKRGIVHRDVKPDNILVDLDGEPQLTDFGIAKNVEREVGLTKSGALLGTPAYMAPEQANPTKDKIGPLTDVYSLGATLYHLLTGRPPYKGESPLEILVDLIEKEPEPPQVAAKKAKRPPVDADLATICQKAMEKRASERYASAAALADDLEAWLDDRPIAARPIGATERLKKLVRRNRAAFVGLLVAFSTLMLLAVGFGVVLAVNIDRTSDSLRIIDHQAAVDQATTLERAITTNMKQGRADVVRELVSNLRGDPKLSRIEVVRVDKTLAYTDRSTQGAVQSRMASEKLRDWVKAKKPAMAPKLDMLMSVAVPAMQEMAAPKEPPRFDVDDATWRDLLAKGEMTSREEVIDGKKQLTLMKPIPNGEACQICHGWSGPDAEQPAWDKPAHAGDGYGYDDEAGPGFDPENKIRGVL